MRTFFALPLEHSAQQAIVRWRDFAIPGVGRAVPPANLHITLHFLGAISARQCEQLCSRVERVGATRFGLCVNQIGYFPRANVVWLAPDFTPPSLRGLVGELRKVANRANLRIARNAHQPHITVLRGCTIRPPLPTPPSFSLAFDGFGFFQSIDGAHGVRYEAIRTWRFDDVA